MAHIQANVRASKVSKLFWRCLSAVNGHPKYSQDCRWLPEEIQRLPKSSGVFQTSPRDFHIVKLSFNYLDAFFSLIFSALCKPGTFLKNFYCVPACGAGYYGNSNTRKCEKCASSCRTCLDGDVPSKCSSCNSPLYIQGIVWQVKCDSVVKLKEGLIPVSTI